MLANSRYIIMGSISGIEYPVVVTNPTTTRFYGVAANDKWLAFSVRDDKIYQTDLTVTQEHLDTIKSMTDITMDAGGDGMTHYNVPNTTKSNIAAGVKILP